jgi:hypothetical protein
MVLLQSQFQPNILTMELLENLKVKKCAFRENGHSWNSQVTIVQDRPILLPQLL